jgi:protein phosphatase methylesterase 1
MSLQKNSFQNRLKLAEQKLGFDFNEDLESNTLSNSKSDSLLNNNLKDINDESSKKLFEGLPLSTWNEVYDKNDIYCNSEGYCFQTYYKQPVITNENNNISNDDTNNDEDSPVIFIGHHGAGSSGLTFHELTKSIKNTSIDENYFTIPGFLTFDMRGHGNTNLINKTNKILNDLSYNLSIDQLIEDFEFLFNHFMFTILKKFDNVSIFLIGHSLGGSILTKFVSNSTKNSYYKYIKGLIIIDIVEETAIKSLSSMNSYLNNLPKSFNSIQDAINWHLNNHLINNLQSCKVSIPSIINYDSINKNYKFIINLNNTKSFWNDWFIGLSDKFIKIPNKISKLLILANNDYLDKDLIIGQMQGKYQLIVFHSNDLNLKNIITTSTTTINNDSKKIGHFIHEDIPNKLSISLLEFVERNDNLIFHKTKTNPQLDLINKLNKKWNVKK